MKFLSVLLLAAAGTALSKGNKNSTQAQCKQMFKLEQLTKLAANDTLLSQKTDNNATKIEKIKAKASEAATKLQSLQSNSTLMETCSQIQAVRSMQHDCEKMVKLQKLMALAGNQTALDTKANGNTTKADAIKAKAEAKKAEVEALQSNSTLTAYCSVLETRQACRAMSEWQKDVERAGNQTFLESKFDGNTTKIDRFKAKVAKGEEKLKTLQSNLTLADACAALKSTTGAGAVQGGTSSDLSSDAPAGVNALVVSASLAVFTTGLIAL